MSSKLRCYLGMDDDNIDNNSCVAVFANNYREARNILYEHIADELTFGEYILSIGKDKDHNIKRQKHIVVPDDAVVGVVDDERGLKNRIYWCLHETFVCPLCKETENTKYRDDNEKIICCVHCNTN